MKKEEVMGENRRCLRIIHPASPEQRKCKKTSICGAKKYGGRKEGREMSVQQNVTQDDQYWQNRIAEDNYNDMRMINRTETQLGIRGNAKLQYEIQKAELRQREKEAERGIYEEINFDEAGRPYLVTRNLWIDTKPRELSNIRHPQLTCVARRSCLEEYVVVIDCEVNENTRMIYLDPKKIGRGTYLLGKLMVAGVCIYAAEKQAKHYARLLFCWLQVYEKKSVIPDEPGWIEIDGKFVFIPEGRMTWKEIEKLL